MTNSDKEFEQRIKTTLESGVTNLDAETRSRLARIRSQALEQKPVWTRWLAFESRIPVAALASVAFLALTLALVFMPSRPDSSVQLALQDSDIALEVLFSENEHEDISDPDFYVWLDMALLEDEDPKHAG